MKTSLPRSARPSARARDAAVLLPVIGAFLVMPPVITLFTAARSVVGVPLIVAYLFGVWLLLIVCTALLSRRLTEESSPSAPQADAAPREPPTRDPAT